MADIRAAIPEDANQIAAFWNPVIRDTTITFSSEEKTPQMITEMITSRPFFVACDRDQVIGFATYGQFRGGNGYRKAMEHTIILSDIAKGRGIGRALMASIEQDARDKGFHIMVAAVAGENTAGIAFHEACGYIETGRMPEAGYKFDRYLELVLLQKIL